jgi:hypothetical protein
MNITIIKKTLKGVKTADIISVGRVVAQPLFINLTQPLWQKIKNQ